MLVVVLLVKEINEVVMVNIVLLLLVMEVHC